MAPENLTRYAWLSLAAALATMGLKLAAYGITGSVGLLSDALESLVNLAAAGLALWALSVASRAPDDDHPFGHEKAELFSAGFEGGLILMAALGIGWTALPRFIHPQMPEQIGLGAVLAGLASGINGAVAWVLLRSGKRHHSLTLEADAHHLLTDVWSSAAVLAGVALASLTQTPRLDPLLALAVAGYISRTGFSLLRRAGDGLMDHALEPEEVARIEAVLGGRPGVTFHALRTRKAGRSSFVQVHVLVPGHWTVCQGHALLEDLEQAILQEVPRSRVITHLEPLEEPCSFDDISLDRAWSGQQSTPAGGRPARVDLPG